MYTHMYQKNTQYNFSSAQPPIISYLIKDLRQSDIYNTPHS